MLRITALHDCRILDTSPEESFDELTRLLAQVCQAPIAIISFIDSQRQWNKSQVGLILKEIPRHQSICAYTILEEEGLVIEDCVADTRFASTPLVMGAHGIRFYAGAPLRTSEGLAVGCVAVMDTRPRTITKETKSAIQTIARQAAAQLALRRTLLDLQQKHSQTQFVLRETQSVYHSLVESLPQNIFRKDIHGRFIFANSKFCSLLNRPKADIIGKTDHDLFPPHLAAKYRADDLEVLTNRKIIDTTEQHQTAKDLLYVHVVKTPVFNAQGDVTGIQGIFWDETERHKAQEEIANARDAAIENARLKSEFLANMSHEIRTPMNAVIGMTGLLLDTQLNSEQRDFADTIRLSAESLLRIVNDVLDFSRIEAGKLVVETIDFNLSQVVKETHDLFIDRAKAKGLNFSTRIAEEVPMQLCGDPGRVRQILTNLLGNAVKFTEKGDVALNVARVTSSGGRVQVRFTISDSGIGIPAEAHTKIFQAFTQADGSVTRRYGGTGLGLAITKQLVELMGGQIGLSSEPGKGSTFWFELAFACAVKPAAESTDAAAAQSKKAAESTAKSTKAPFRLLLAEDNPVNQKVALRQLTKLGFEVDAVNNGLEAVKALERQLYPIVLMDCQMPELDGYQATERIRAMQRSTSLRWAHRPYIIAMTANALAGDREVCLAAGMDDYVSKPVRMEELESALQRGRAAMEKPAENAAPLVDKNAIEGIRALRMEGEPDPLAELVHLFINDTPERISQLHAALKHSAAYDLEAAAHSLKGSASNLGAVSIAAACGSLMQHAKHSEFPPVAKILKSIETDFAKVKQLLLEEVKR